MPSRREFCKLTALGLVACSAPRKPAPDLVRLLEETPREQVLEALVPHLRAGLGVAALGEAILAAGTRQVVPRTTFSKEHHVLACMHAVRQVSAALPRGRRFHPLLWSADYLKEAQATSQAAPLGAPPPAGPADLAGALADFDGPRAEAAVVALHRRDPEAAIAALWRHASQDLRHIGHKPIHVATALAVDRSLPVLRSLALTLALHYEEPGRDLDGTWAQAGRLATDLPHGELDTPLLDVFRTAEPADALAEVAARLRAGLSRQAVWDGCFLASAELLMNNRGSVEALHAVTSSNAVYAVWRAVPSDLRDQVLLQHVARVADFHRYTAWWAARRNRPGESHRIDEIAPAGPEVLAGAATRALEHAVDSHDFKLWAAVAEDIPRLSAAHRGRYLAACAVRFRRPDEARSSLLPRLDEVARAAGLA